MLVEVDGVGEEAAVGAGGDGDEGGEVDGGGHDEAAGVVGVLADEVDAAGGAEEVLARRSRWRGGGRRVRRVFAWMAFRVLRFGASRALEKDFKNVKVL